MDNAAWVDKISSRVAELNKKRRPGEAQALAIYLPSSRTLTGLGREAWRSTSKSRSGSCAMFTTPTLGVRPESTAYLRSASRRHTGKSSHGTVLMPARKISVSSVRFQSDPAHRYKPFSKWNTGRVYTEEYSLATIRKALRRILQPYVEGDLLAVTSLPMSAVDGEM